MMNDRPTLNQTQVAVEESEMKFVELQSSPKVVVDPTKVVAVKEVNPSPVGKFTCCVMFDGGGTLFVQERLDDVMRLLREATA